MSMEKLLAAFPAPKAEALLRDTVHLASASSSFLPTPPGIVLSMGAFGASQCRGEEYTANYPPPHGPASQHKTAGNFFVADQPAAQEAERAAELTLKEYHLAKLRVVAHDREAWQKVEWVGFETIPAFAEIRAARAAMEALKLDLRQFYRSDGPAHAGIDDKKTEQERPWFDKPFWITSAYTESEFPQYKVNKGDITPADVVDELLRPLDGHAVPDGIGLNCTHPRHLPRLIPQLTARVKQLLSEQGATLGSAPRLVVYPDGGAKYDAIAKDWTDRDFDPSSWAAKVLEEVCTADGAETGQGQKVWQGVIVGGCCKTSFAEICALKTCLATPQK